MWCHNCGTKLIDQAKFCSNCGTKTAQPEAQGAPQPEPDWDLEDSAEPEKVRFNLLGYVVGLPPVTEQYVEIRNQFEVLALDARQRIYRNFETRYRNLDELIRYADHDVDELISSAMRQAVDLLQSRRIYNVNMSKFIDTAADYIGVWEEQFGEIRDKFSELQEYKEAKKEYRANRKDSRGRITGGGFGVGGAAKGMAMAGTANMATGILHSFANAIGNAATSAEVSNLKGKIYNDPETRRRLCMAVYSDVYEIHRAVIEYINDNSDDYIPDLYTDDDVEEAIIIYNNIVNGNVKTEDVDSALVDILIKDPFDPDYYKLALKWNEDQEDELTEYASYFGVEIDDLIEEMHETKRVQAALAQRFGSSAPELDGKLQANGLYHSVKADLADNESQAIHHAFQSIINDAMKTSLYWVSSGMSNDKMITKLENAKTSYAPMLGETPLVLFDNTAFGSAKDGFIMTERAIYGKNMMSKPWSVEFEAVKHTRLSGSDIHLDDKTIDINQITGSDRQKLYEFVELAVFVAKYGGRIGRGASRVDAAAEVAVSVESTASQAVPPSSQLAVRQPAEQMIEDIQNIVLGISNDSMRRYTFVPNESDKVNKKFVNAFEAYAPLEPGEIPVMLYDNTAFGSAKDGFLLTDRRIYAHNMLQKPFSFALSEIASVQLQGSDLLINSQAIYINLISSAARGVFKTHVEDFINRLA